MQILIARYRKTILPPGGSYLCIFTLLRRDVITGVLPPGTIVTHISMEDIRQMYELRQILEPQIVQLAVKRGHMEKIREDAIQVSMNYGSSTSIPASDKVPEFSQICFSHITCKEAKTGIDLCSLRDSPIKQLRVEEVSLHAQITERISFCV